MTPALVLHDKEGKPYAVRYDQVNAMLLNKFLKEHNRVEAQEATIAELKSTVARQQENARRQQEQIAIVMSGVRKVSAQLRTGKPALQMGAPKSVN